MELPEILLHGRNHVLCGFCVRSTIVPTSTSQKPLCHVPSSRRRVVWKWAKGAPLTNSHQISRSIGIFRGLRLASPCWNHWMWISGFLHQPSPNLAIPPLEDRITLKHSFSAKMVELISAASCWMIWMRIRIWIWAQHLWIVKAISG